MAMYIYLKVSFTLPLWIDRNLMAQKSELGHISILGQVK